MRTSLAMLFVAAAAGVASAQPSEALVISPAAPSESGMWIDFGVGAGQFERQNGEMYGGEYVRFAPQVTLSRHLYVGAELAIGSLVTHIDQTTGSAARGDSTGGTMPTTNRVDGPLGAANLVGGVRLMAGPFSGGVELAAGVRYTTLTGLGNQSVGEGTGVVEARGRFETWVTPHVTAGALIGTDLGHQGELNVSVSVGFHFEPFDHTSY